MLVHGRHGEAEREVAGIEAIAARQRGPLDPSASVLSITVRAQPTMSEIAHVLLRRYPRRTLLGLALMISQAFFYNAIFFTYALVLTRFQGVPDSQVGLYIFPFAIANFLGPLILGPLFDRIGRRRMIALTYALSGTGLLATGYGFMQGWLDATTHGRLHRPGTFRHAHRDRQRRQRFCRLRDRRATCAGRCGDCIALRC